jgi:hypothetical protein
MRERPIASTRLCRRAQIPALKKIIGPSRTIGPLAAQAAILLIS